MSFSLDYSVKQTGAKSTRVNFNLDADITGVETLKDFLANVKLAQILTAREALRREQRDGFDKDPITKVDGAIGRRTEQVKPLGKIEYFSRISDLTVLLAVYKAIEDRSPTRTGQYRNSNYVFANNRLVATNFSEFANYVESTKETGIGEIQDIRFLNVTPYGSRLEYQGVRRVTKGINKGLNKSKRRTGKTRGGGSPGRTIKKPNGAYFLASRTLRDVKGLFAQVKYEFIPNGYKGITISANGVFRTSYANTPKNRAKRRVGKPYVYPSIVFRISKLGIVR